MTLPWRPRTILSGYGDLTLWNAMTSWAGERLPLAGGAAFVFQPAEAPDPGLRAHRLGFEGGASVVAVPISFPFQALFGTAVDVDDIGTLPDPLRSRIERAMFAKLLGATGDPRLAAARVEASGPLAEIAEAGPGWRWLELAFGLAGGGAAALIVGGDVGAVVPRLVGGTILPRAAVDGIADRLEARLTRRLGTLVATASAVAALGTGDVVVLAEDEARRVVLSGASALWHFAPADGGLRLTSVEPRRHPLPPQPHQHEDAPMSDAPAGSGSDRASNSDRPATGPGDLPVEVEFSIGQVTVPLGQLATWAPGAIVPLDPPQPAAGVRVALSVAGRDIGYGDLVEIDQRLAVRLTHLFDRSSGGAS